jgi:hypothetical protein
MRRTIQTQVISIENEDGENPRVVLQCPEGEIISPKTAVMTKAIFRDQEPLVAATDRIKVLGKGKPSVDVGDTVEVQLLTNPS